MRGTTSRVVFGRRRTHEAKIIHTSRELVQFLYTQPFFLSGGAGAGYRFQIFDGKQRLTHADNAVEAKKCECSSPMVVTRQASTFGFFAGGQGGLDTWRSINRVCLENMLFKKSRSVAEIRNLQVIHHATKKYVGEIII